ncbi:MAG: sigma-70 family RNA polymerase sigma factor [Acidobacteriia bacterium]|nr:sigma-70 family RNA polymerase sigma factor [Terriglobia bacterium]
MTAITIPDRDRLVETFRSYAHAIAAEVLRKFPSLERDEVRGAAELGLVEAAGSFDPSRGVLFKTFAYYRIRGSIYDNLRKMGWFAKEGARLRFESAANEYMSDYSETAAANGSPQETHAELQDIASSVVNCYFLSLSSVTQELPETGVKSPEESYAQNEAQKNLHKALSQLPPKNRQVLEDYYFRDQTLDAIGQRLGLSKSWVSRLHAKSLDLLREAVRQTEKGDSRNLLTQHSPVGNDNWR